MKTFETADPRQAGPSASLRELEGTVWRLRATDSFRHETAVLVTQVKEDPSAGAADTGDQSVESLLEGQHR